MADNRWGGTSIELTKQSKHNFDVQMNKLGTVAPEKAFKMIVTLLLDIKTLAQQKLKFNRHIKTSRLRNSLYVKTIGQKYANLPDNSISYKDKDNKSYSSDFDVDLEKYEGSVGTNVDYASKIEYLYDSFLYWAMKNVNIEKRGRETAKELLNGIK